MWIKFFMYIFDRILNRPRFQIMPRFCIGFRIWRGSLRKLYIIHARQDSSGSEYGRVPDMPGLLKVLNRTLRYRYLIGFWIRLYFLNSKFTKSWGFCVNCILEIHGILNMHQVPNIPGFSMYQESWNLNMLEFHRVYW